LILAICSQAFYGSQAGAGKPQPEKPHLLMGAACGVASLIGANRSGPCATLGDAPVR
jgi:hypothetical protein